MNKTIETMAGRARHSVRAVGGQRTARPTAAFAVARLAVAKRLDCGVFSAALHRTFTPRCSKSGDQSPHSRRFAQFASASLAGRVSPLRAFHQPLLPGAHRAARSASRFTALSLTPWLQPGVRTGQRTRNRFNGFSRHSKAVETAGRHTLTDLHRAKAAVLVRKAGVA